MVIKCLQIPSLPSRQYALVGRPDYTRQTPNPRVPKARHGIEN